MSDGKEFWSLTCGSCGAEYDEIRTAADLQSGTVTSKCPKCGEVNRHETKDLEGQPSDPHSR